MTITFVGAGVAATGNNVSVVPALPAGLADGDLILILASIRNSGAGTVNLPAGWASVVSSGNMSILGRYYAAGVTAPTVTFSGGVLNADAIAQAIALRGVEASQLFPAASAAQLNGSAQNIAYPALPVPADGHAVVMFLWKQDDATSLATPAGFTAVGLTSAIAGDDALQAVYYQIQTIDTDITAGSVVVTGGLAAISRGALVALKPAAAITAVQQDAFPPRVLVSVTGLTIGDDVALYRVVAGQRTLVRAGTAADVIDPSFLRVDAELPFGVPVSYTAVVNDTVEYTTTPVTYTLPGGLVVVSDAITGDAASATISSWDEKGYDRRSSVFKVGGRNVVVSGDLGLFQGSIEMFFDTYSAGQVFFELLQNATQGIVQIRRPISGYDGVDCYVSVLTAKERRFSQDGSDPRRTWIVDVAEVDGWAPELLAVGFTYGDVATFYAPAGTYATASADFATYLAAEQGDYSP